MENEGPYTGAWRRYRRWSRAFWILFVLYLPGLAGAHRALGATGAANGATLFVVALAWMIAFAVVGYRKWNFRCPRCSELFFRSFDDRLWRRVWRHNPLARRCMHCGLPKWAARDPDPRPRPTRSAGE